MFTIRPFDPADTDAVIAIWQACGLTRPWNNPQQDIARKMRVQPDLFLVGLSVGTPIGTAMFGYDTHRGWLYYFAFLPDHQNKGYGAACLPGGKALARLGAENQPADPYYSQTPYPFIRHQVSRKTR